MHGISDLPQAVRLLLLAVRQRQTADDKSCTFNCAAAARVSEGPRVHWLLRQFRRLCQAWREPIAHNMRKDGEAYEQPMDWPGHPAEASPRIHAAAMAAVQIYQTHCEQGNRPQVSQEQDRWSQVFAAYYSGDTAGQQSSQRGIPAALRIQRQQRWEEIDGLLTGLRAG
jgi:hypothetical protein